MLEDMLERSSRMMGFFALTLAACSLDSTNPSGSGTGSGGMAASSTSGATQATTDATTGSTTSGLGGMSSSTSGDASSTDASSSTDAASSSSDASSSASSSSGGPTDFAFCNPTADNFNGYLGDAGFATVGEGIAGPWGEIGENSGAVKWIAPGQIQTQFGAGKAAYLYLKGGIQVGTGNCATTVRLVSTNGHVPAFGFSDGGNPATFYAQLRCEESAGNCHPLAPFGFSGTNVDIGQGILLGIVVKNKHVFGLYDSGSGWTLLPGVPSGGFDASNLFNGQVFLHFGQETGNDMSTWDDFNITPIPTAAVP